jgi:quercetin dioxygenase-like cupin family protein
MTTEANQHDPFRCPTCQQQLQHTKIDVVDVAAAIKADALGEKDVFKRTYLGHGSQSSVFVFQGHAGPFRRHVHETHDEIGYVLKGSGEVNVGGVTRPVKPGDVWVIPAGTPHGGQFGDPPQVLFISSPIDDPDHQDRVWLDE